MLVNFLLAAEKINYFPNALGLTQLNVHMQNPRRGRSETSRSRASRSSSARGRPRGQGRNRSTRARRSGSQLESTVTRGTSSPLEASVPGTSSSTPFEFGGIQQPQPGLELSQPEDEPGSITIAGVQGTQSVAAINGEIGPLLSMNLIVGPPQEVRPGTILNPPLIVRLEKVDASENGPVDISRLVGIVSVTSEDGNTSLAPPRSDLVAGRVADSVRPLSDGEDSNREEIGYLTYSDIRIQDPGRYRLRVSLMEVDTGNAPGAGGATNIQNALSHVISVHNAAEDSTPGEEEAARLEYLNQRGLRI